MAVDVLKLKMSIGAQRMSIRTLEDRHTQQHVRLTKDELNLAFAESFGWAPLQSEERGHVAPLLVLAQRYFESSDPKIQRIPRVDEIGMFIEAVSTGIELYSKKPGMPVLVAHAADVLAASVLPEVDVGGKAIPEPSRPVTDRIRRQVLEGLQQCFTSRDFVDIHRQVAAQCLRIAHHLNGDRRDFKGIPFVPA